jgi:hypothetical protein
MVVKLADMSVSGAIVPANRNFIKLKREEQAQPYQQIACVVLHHHSGSPQGAAGNFVLIVILV